MPVLFISSKQMSKDTQSRLKDLGTVLNLEDPHTDDEIKAYASKAFILCNLQDKQQVSRMRFINHETVDRVCILRKSECSSDHWIKKLDAKYTIKSLHDVVTQSKTSEELMASIKSINMFSKKPVSTSLFYLKKVYSFLSSLF